MGEQASPHPYIPTCSATHACALVRTTKSLPIAQKQAGWARLQLAYLSVTDEEVREAMRTVEA
jgi:hypothetical protein